MRNRHTHLITFSPERFRPDGEVLDYSVPEFLTDYIRESCDCIEKVLTVLPNPSTTSAE